MKSNRPELNPRAAYAMAPVPLHEYDPDALWVVKHNRCSTETTLTREQCEDSYEHCSTCFGSHPPLVRSAAVVIDDLIGYANTVDPSRRSTLALRHLVGLIKELADAVADTNENKLSAQRGLTALNTHTSGENHES